MPPVLAVHITRTEADLLHLEREELIRYADYLEQPIVEMDESSAFAAIVKTAIDKLGVDPGALAKRFGQHRTTIARWKAGKSAPQPMARPLVVGWIGQELRRKAEVLDGQLRLVSA